MDLSTVVFTLLWEWRDAHKNFLRGKQNYKIQKHDRTEYFLLFKNKLSIWKNVRLPCLLRLLACSLKFSLPWDLPPLVQVVSLPKRSRRPMLGCGTCRQSCAGWRRRLSAIPYRPAIRNGLRPTPKGMAGAPNWSGGRYHIQSLSSLNCVLA